MSEEIKSVYETLEKIDKLKQHKRKIDQLKEAYSLPLRTILQGSFNQKINMKMPEGEPPYTPNEEAELSDKPYQNLKNIMNFKLHQWKREKIFIDMLQSVPHKDAPLLIAMKDKKLTEIFPTINKELVQEVWPELV